MSNSVLAGFLAGLGASQPRAVKYWRLNSRYKMMKLDRTGNLLELRLLLLASCPEFPWPSIAPFSAASQSGDVLAKVL